ncbi:WD40 repeat domain-containing protein [Paraburkholderia azotifigens]|uniref:WD40 repeat domain-containing protein n=1 Tax=Paraburkholderia azotifigens TaxID=2057004 RepID=UPI0038BDCFDD
MADDAVEPGDEKLSTDALTPSRPWPGLASFTEADQYFFRGRENEGEELARLVRREVLTVLFGRSGLGKTSLLNAGLFPRLRENLHVPVMIRLAHGAALPLRDQVWQALAAACSAAGVDATEPLPGASLWEHFHRAGAGFWNARNRAVIPVLVFDQFEELFTLGQVDEETRRRAAGFVNELSDLIENRPPEALRQALDAGTVPAERIDFGRRDCKVVLSFREDFLADVEGLRGSIPSLMRNRYRLLPMDGYQARAVVDSGSALVAPAVAECIIGLAWRNRAEAPSPDDYSRMEVDPALLSVICSELNLRRIAQGSDHIGAELVASAEREILVDFYERSLRDVDPRVRVFIEDELITAAGHRDSYALEDALVLPGISRADIERLVAGRLLRVDDRFGVRRLELTHDVLTRVVKDSRDARQAREAAAAAAARVREALEIQRRNRRNAMWVGAGFVFAVALLLVAAYAAYEATVQRDRARTAQNDAVAAKQQLVKETEKSIQAKLAIEEAQEKMKQAAVELQKMGDSAAEADRRAKEAQAVAAKDAALAAIQQKRADEATTHAGQLTREAMISGVIANASSEDAEHPDRALLLGAEASHADPLRLDAQLAQLARLIADEGVHKMLRIGDKVTASATSADGKRMAMGTDGGDVIDLDMTTWTVLRRWRGHDAAVRALAYDQGASRLVSADAKGNVIAWQVRDAKEIGRVTVRDAREIRRIVVSHRGQFVAVGSSASVYVWTMPGQPGDAVLKRVGSGDGQCLGFDREDATLLYGFGDSIVAAPLPATGTAPSPRATRPLLARTPDCRFDALLHTNPDGKRVVELRDESSDTVIGTLDADAGELQAVFEPRGGFFALRGAQATSVWKIQPLQKIGTIRHESGRAVRMSLSPDGRWLATALASGEEMIQPTNGGRARVKTRQGQRVAGFQFSPNGDTVAYQVDQQETLYTIWSLAPGSVLRSGKSLYYAEEVEFNRSGKVLATVPAGTDIADFWNPDDAMQLRSESGMLRAEFSPDGSLLAIQRANGTVDVLDMTGHVLRQLQKPADADVERFAISWDNRRLAITLSDGSIHVYEITAAGRETVLSGKRGSEVVAFSPDGRVLAVAGDDGVVRLFRFGSQKPMIELPDPHKESVRQLAFSPDGKRLVSGGDEQMAILHDVESGQTVAKFGPHDGPVDRLVFIGNGEALVSGDAKGERHVWDLRKGSQLARLRAAGGTVSSVDISPGGRRVAVLHEDQTVSLRNWDSESMLTDACAIANRNLDCAEWRQFMSGAPYRKTCAALPAPKPACH